MKERKEGVDVDVDVDLDVRDGLGKGVLCGREVDGYLDGVGCKLFILPAT